MHGLPRALPILICIHKALPVLIHKDRMRVIPNPFSENFPRFVQGVPNCTLQKSWHWPCNVQAIVYICHRYIHCKKHLLFWQLHFSPELQLLNRIVPCGSQLWAIQHTWSTGTAEVVTRAGRHQISAIHNKRALFPCKEP